MRLGLKLPPSFAATLLLVLCAALYGIHNLDHALDTYATHVQARNQHERQSDALAMTFKIQVQEWKNTLLRGKEGTGQILGCL